MTLIIFLIIFSYFSNTILSAAHGLSDKDFKSALYREVDQNIWSLLQQNGQRNKANEYLSYFLDLKVKFRRISSKVNSANIVRILLDCGLDSDSINESLLQSADNDWPEIVKILLEYGGNPNFKDGFDFTPFTLAILRQSFESIQLLLENGANINTLCRKLAPLELLLGRYDLYYGIDQIDNVIEIAALLLDAGCNPFLINIDGDNVFSFLAHAKNLNLSLLLLDYAKEIKYNDKQVFIYRLYRCLRDIPFDDNTDTETKIYKFLYSIRKEKIEKMIQKINHFLRTSTAKESPVFIKQMYAFLNMHSKKAKKSIKKVRKLFAQQEKILEEQIIELEKV